MTDISSNFFSARILAVPTGNLFMALYFSVYIFLCASASSVFSLAFR